MSKRKITPSEIKRVREALGLSQEEFAEELGVSIVTVSRWERGLNTLNKIAERAIEKLKKEHGLD